MLTLAANLSHGTKPLACVCDEQYMIIIIIIIIILLLV